MKRTAVLLLAASAWATSSFANSDRPQDHLLEKQVTSPPIGYVQFCRQYSAACATRSSATSAPTMTAHRWRELNEINDQVNRSVQPVTDADQYGLEEYWTYPLNKGDCEDYVLMKRKLLLDLGWSKASLLITVVRDMDGGGHAVLVVESSAGDLILDNQDPAIRLWSETPYRYLKRQSRRDPSIWVDLEDNRQISELSNAPTTTAATLRR